MPFCNMKNLISTLVLLLGIFAAQAQKPFKEFIYAQTDKNFYLAGERIWVKLYNLDEHNNLHQGSRVAYVQLVGDTPNTIQCVLEMDSASADGVLELPFTVASGRYKLCAYTRNMLNMGEEAIFSKTIHVFNPLRYDNKVDKVAVEQSVAYQPFDGGDLHISTDKTTYSPRQEVTIDLSALPADAVMAVSVARADGWRLCDTDIAHYNVPSLTISGNLTPETESQIIEGTYTSSNGTPALNANLSLRSPVVRYYPGIVDNSDNVQYFTPLMHGVNTAFTGVERGGSIELKSPFRAPLLGELIPVEIARGSIDDIQERSIGIQAARYFGTDSIGYRPIAVDGLHRYELTARYDMDNYRRFNSFKETFIEYIYLLSTTTIDGKQRITMFDEFTGRQNNGNTLVLLDGVAVMNHEDLLNYNPHYCRYIDIYVGHYVFANQEYAGILNIRTPRGNKMHFALPDNSREQSLLNGIQLPATMALVCRDSNAAPMPAQSPDTRHTLYWNPEAKATTLKCFTSDLKGTFVVTVEGITPDGKRIQANTQFTVK